MHAAEMPRQHGAHGPGGGGVCRKGGVLPDVAAWDGLAELDGGLWCLVPCRASRYRANFLSLQPASALRSSVSCCVDCVNNTLCHPFQYSHHRWASLVVGGQL